MLHAPDYWLLAAGGMIMSQIIAVSAQYAALLPAPLVMCV
jgi:hypothetical protein